MSEKYVPVEYICIYLMYITVLCLIIGILLQLTTQGDCAFGSLVYLFASTMYKKKVLTIFFYG